MPIVYSTTARADFIRFVEHCLFIVTMGVLIGVMGIAYIPNQEGVKPVRQPEAGELPTAYIIDPIKDGVAPYITLKPEVADKRRKAGDIVTLYYRQHPPVKDIK